MNTDYVVYDGTGVIVALVNCDSSVIAANAGANSYLVGTADIDNDYVDLSGAPTVTPRAALSTVATWSSTTLTADGVDSITFGSGLPNPSDISVIGPAGVQNALASVTTGTLTLTVARTGFYQITVTAFPYITETFLITGV